MLAFAGILAAHADLTVRGKAVAIVDGKECPEAALVCVTNGVDEAVEWHTSPYTNDGRTVVGAAVTERHNFTLVFNVQPAEGYRFVGWSTGKMGTTLLTTNPTYTWTGNNGMQSVTTKTYYAILAPTGATEPADAGDGVQLVGVRSGQTFTAGSSSRDWAVRLDFAEPLAYQSYTAYAEGYGVDRTLQRFVTCRTADGTEARITDVRVTGQYEAAGADAGGLIMLSSDVQPGDYTLHLPYGLFRTASGGVTAAADIPLQALLPADPFTLVATSPELDVAWDCLNDPDNQGFMGTDISITFQMNRVISQVGDALAVQLSASYGANYVPERVEISRGADKTRGIVALGPLPNGDYTLTLPAGTFVDALGMPSAEVVYTFSVTGSSEAQWTLPSYTAVGASPASGSTVSALREVAIDLSRPGFDAPVGLMPGAAAVQAFILHESFPEGADPNDPEVQPVVTTTPIEGVTAKVTEGRLVCRFAHPVAEVCRLLLAVPRGITHNLYMPVAAMTPREVFEEGGCTNPAMQFTYNVVPADVPVTDVTGPGYDTRYLTDDEGNFVRDAEGQYIRIDRYDSLVDATLTPPSPDGDGTDGDRVTVLYFWYDEEFATCSYTGGATVTCLTTGRSLPVSMVGFKQGGDAHRRDVIELRLSGEAFIQSAQQHQGVYEVVLPAGIALTEDGRKNAGFTFRFTYGDPQQAWVPTALDLTDYVGDYRAVHEEGEEAVDEWFSLSADTAGSYAVTGLDGSPLVIPVEQDGERTVLRFTEDAAGWAFMSPRGGDVEMTFQTLDGRRYIYLDDYALYAPSADPIMGGVILYERVTLTPQSLPHVSSPACPQRSWDIYGRTGRTTSPIRIAGGRKMMVK